MTKRTVKRTVKKMMCGMLLIATLSCAPALSAAAQEPDYSIENTLLEEINALRADNGVAALSWSEDLTETADLRAKEAATVWSHTRPDGTGRETAFPEVYQNASIAENLSRTNENTEAGLALMFSMLCQSPSHYKNMIDSSHTEIHISVYHGIDDCFYFSFEFGGPVWKN